MVRKSQEWPDEGELIVGTVYKVVNYGAFANLEEYAGKEAFIHISEVSSGWVKNIRDHVRENQKIVARVLRVNPKKGHVKFLELAAKSLDKDLDTAYDEVGYELMDIFGDIYGAFESASEEGAETLTEEGISQEWADAITEVAEKNIQPPEVHISGYVDIKNYNPDGVEVIKKALMAAEAENIEVQCVGAPRYRITVTSTDYLVAEKQLKEAAEKAIAIVEDADGTGEFLREIEN